MLILERCRSFGEVAMYLVEVIWRDLAINQLNCDH